MGLRLVDDDLDMSFEIPLETDARHALSVQLQRTTHRHGKLLFEMRLCDQLQKLIDADLRPPSARQIAYALSIAKELDIALPGEALRHRGSMFDFLDRYVPLFKHRFRTGDRDDAFGSQ
jgi:hypothetical protein